MFKHASRRRAVIAPAILAMLASSFSLLLTTAPAQANPAGTGLVISEVYGGGGNSGATLTNDFIELYNPTDVADQRQRLVGAVPQLRAVPVPPRGVTPLSGTVPAGATTWSSRRPAAAARTALPARRRHRHRSPWAAPAAR